MFKILRCNQLFENKTPDLKMSYVILVKTRDQYKKLMKYLEEIGCTWMSRDKPTSKDVFDDYKNKNFCIWLKHHEVLNRSLITHGSLDFYEKNKKNKYADYIFITVKEFIENVSEHIEKRRLKMKETHLKYIDIDPYGEENWIDENANSKNKIIPLPSPYPSTNAIRKWYDDNYDNIVDKTISFVTKQWDRRTQDYELDNLEKFIIDAYFSEGYLFLVDEEKRIYKIKGKKIEIILNKEKVINKNDPYDEENWENEYKINEIFESERTYNYEFVKKNTWMDPYIDFIYKFKSKDNILYFVTVSFNKMNNYLGVKFADEKGFTGTLKYLLKNGPFDKYYDMDKHDAINVINTVVKICKDFALEHRELNIKGFKTWTFNQKRVNIYKYILGKYFKGWDINSYLNKEKEYVIECKPI
jgi:hypothetical protein